MVETGNGKRKSGLGFAGKHLYNQYINGLILVLDWRSAMSTSKIKQDEIHIGENIRRIRLEKGVGQTELVRRLQLAGVEMTRETLVKIERGIQHIQATQLRGIRDVLSTTYDELLE